MSQAVRLGALRQGIPSDIAAVAAIERASFSDPWSEAMFREFLPTPGAIFLVATRASTKAVVGYLVALVVAAEAEVLNLAVSPVERGKGLGGELLDAGLASVRDRGVVEVFLEVRESNAAALALYGSRGFKTFSRRQSYYRTPVEDALLLRRAIAIGDVADGGAVNEIEG